MNINYKKNLSSLLFEEKENKVRPLQSLEYAPFFLVPPNEFQPLKDQLRSGVYKNVKTLLNKENSLRGNTKSTPDEINSDNSLKDTAGLEKGDGLANLPYNKILNIAKQFMVKYKSAIKSLNVEDEITRQQLMKFEVPPVALGENFNINILNVKNEDTSSPNNNDLKIYTELGFAFFTLTMKAKEKSEEGSKNDKINITRYLANNNNVVVFAMPIIKNFTEEQIKELKKIGLLGKVNMEESFVHNSSLKDLLFESSPSVTFGRLLSPDEINQALSKNPPPVDPLASRPETSDLGDDPDETDLGNKYKYYKDWKDVLDKIKANTLTTIKSPSENRTVNFLRYNDNDIGVTIDFENPAGEEERSEMSEQDMESIETLLNMLYSNTQDYEFEKEPSTDEIRQALNEPGGANSPQELVQKVEQGEGGEEDKTEVNEYVSGEEIINTPGNIVAFVDNSRPGDVHILIKKGNDKHDVFRLGESNNFNPYLEDQNISKDQFISYNIQGFILNPDQFNNAQYYDKERLKSAYDINSTDVPDVLIDSKEETLGKLKITKKSSDSKEPADPVKDRENIRIRKELYASLKEKHEDLFNVLKKELFDKFGLAANVNLNDSSIFDYVKKIVSDKSTCKILFEYLKARSLLYKLEKDQKVFKLDVFNNIGKDIIKNMVNSAHLLKIPGKDLKNITADINLFITASSGKLKLEYKENKQNLLNEGVFDFLMPDKKLNDKDLGKNIDYIIYDFPKIGKMVAFFDKINKKIYFFENKNYNEKREEIKQETDPSRRIDLYRDLVFFIDSKTTYKRVIRDFNFVEKDNKTLSQLFSDFGIKKSNSRNTYKANPNQTKTINGLLRDLIYKDYFGNSEIGNALDKKQEAFFKANNPKKQVKDSNQDIKQQKKKSPEDVKIIENYMLAMFNLGIYIEKYIVSLFLNEKANFEKVGIKLKESPTVLTLQKNMKGLVNKDELVSQINKLQKAADSSKDEKDDIDSKEEERNKEERELFSDAFIKQAMSIGRAREISSSKRSSNESLSYMLFDKNLLNEADDDSNESEEETTAQQDKEDKLEYAHQLYQSRIQALVSSTFRVIGKDVYDENFDSNKERQEKADVEASKADTDASIAGVLGGYASIPALFALAGISGATLGLAPAVALGSGYAIKKYGNYRAQQLRNLESIKSEDLKRLEGQIDDFTIQLREIILRLVKDAKGIKESAIFKTNLSQFLFEAESGTFIAWNKIERELESTSLFIYDEEFVNKFEENPRKLEQIRSRFAEKLGSLIKVVFDVEVQGIEATTPEKAGYYTFVDNNVNMSAPQGQSAMPQGVANALPNPPRSPSGPMNEIEQFMSLMNHGGGGLFAALMFMMIQQQFGSKVKKGQSMMDVMQMFFGSLAKSQEELPDDVAEDENVKEAMEKGQDPRWLKDFYTVTTGAIPTVKITYTEKDKKSVKEELLKIQSKLEDLQQNMPEKISGVNCKINLKRKKINNFLPKLFNNYVSAFQGDETKILVPVKYRKYIGDDDKSTNKVEKFSDIIIVSLLSNWWDLNYTDRAFLDYSKNQMAMIDDSKKALIDFIANMLLEKGTDLKDHEKDATDKLFQESRRAKGDLISEYRELLEMWRKL